MGNSTGSYTAKATICPQLYSFTKWGSFEIKQFLERGQKDIPETFALRRNEFDYLVGKLISFNDCRSLFIDVFDTDRNGLVDKFEVMCIICMTSKISSQEKINFFFDLFNFNNKGYLNESELTLLFMAVSRGVFKIDQKFIPPSAKIVKFLVSEAFEYAKTDVGCLRKPELLEFVKDNPDIVAYLECWRGHSSQILLGNHSRWRDLSFPANETAIIHSPRLKFLGMPPSEFVHWRRKDRVGINGCEILFAHEQTFMKTIDRKKVYKGEGLLGTGSFKLGLLADLWLINTLAVVMSRPEMLFFLISPTGQEEEGRYCLRFYENGGWRSVYVDDRIPCSPNNEPLFTSSSCPVECWPMILEKGMAKYFGSYGQLGTCNNRSDSILQGLRLCTGGHPSKYLVQDFDWRSIHSDVEGKNGLKMIQKYFKEGALIAFGRSASLNIMNRNKLNKFKQKDTEFHMLSPPSSRLFPLVGFETVDGFKCLILRDAWGLIGDTNPEVNKTTGHSNTFFIKVEEIPTLYDTLYCCRYSDSIRANADKHKVDPWKTESRFSATQNRSQPAIFLLTVAKNPTDQNKNSKKNLLSKKNSTVDAILQQADMLNEEEPLVEIRVKDRPDLSRKKSKLVPSESGNSTAPKLFMMDDQEEESDLVEVCLTISSGCDWSIAGASEAGAKLRLTLLPTQQPMDILFEKNRIARIEKEHIEHQKLIETQRQSLNISNRLTINSLGSNNPPLPIPTNNTNSIPQTENLENPDSSPPDPYQDIKEVLKKLTFSAQRSWTSETLHLPPGQYLVLCDIEFDISYDKLRLDSLPTDVFESPWIEQDVWTYLNQVKSREKVFHADHYAGHKEDNSVSTAEEGSITSLKRLETNLFETMNKKKIEEDLPHIPKRIYLDVSTKEKLELSVLDDPNQLEDYVPYIFNESVVLIEEPSLSVDDQSYNSNIQAEEESKTSSNQRKEGEEDQSVISQFPKTKIIRQLISELFLLSSEFTNSIPEETWPFIAENQAEVSCRELYTLLTSLKDESEVIGHEFVTLVERYKEDRRKMLKGIN